MIAKKNKIMNFICSLLSLGLFLLAAVTVHDMQTAEGIGLYYALKAGGLDRRWFDLAAVVISMLCLLAVLLLPCMVTGRKNPQSFFRLWCGYLAFVPTVSVSSLIHLLEGKEQIRMSQALLQGHILTAVREGLVQMVPVLVTLVPLLLLFGAVYKDRSDGFSVSRKWGIMLLILTALGVIAVLFPILAPYASYWFCYLLLLETFVLWEKVIEQYPRLNGWGYILFGGCFLRGIYICMEVMSKFHI